jgi:hypothetical protein
MKCTSLAALVAGSLTITAAGTAAQERITWTEQVNVAVRGNTLEKTRGCDGCDDAGATSTQVIEAKGGFVEFRVPDDWTYLVAGLAYRTRGTRFEDIEFGIRLNGNGMADVVENGQYVGGDIDYQAGDTFRLEVANNRVRYLRNGELMATSRKRPTYPLAFDVGLGTVGASIANVRMGGRFDMAAARPQDEFLNNDREFLNHDRNADGLITRREWTGTGRAFNQIDANGDGRITRREFDRDVQADILDVPADRDVAGTSGDLVAVSAIDRWTDTGIMVRAGDSIAFDADGAIQMSGDRNDTARAEGSRRKAPGALVQNAPAGTLIARIGNGAPFAIGARRTIARAPASGRLYLGVNDDYLDDNAGAFEVLVTIEPR